VSLVDIRNAKGEEEQDEVRGFLAEDLLWPSIKPTQNHKVVPQDWEQTKEI
jgi:hypothetical protein